MSSTRILDTDALINPLRTPSSELSRVLQSLKYPEQALPAIVTIIQGATTDCVELAYMFPDGELTHPEPCRDNNRMKKVRADEQFLIIPQERGISLHILDKLTYGSSNTVTDYRTMINALTKWTYQVITAYSNMDMPLGGVKIELGFGHFTKHEKVVDYIDNNSEHNLSLYDTARYYQDDFAKIKLLNDYGRDYGLENNYMLV
jgi:hypothetical protein